MIEARADLTLQKDSLRPGTKLAGLECLRGLAAFYVFVHHYVRRGMPQVPALVRIFSFGQVAVMLFFLVSGFVIHFASTEPGAVFTFGRYLQRRIRRLYPPFLMAMLVTWIGWSLLPVSAVRFSYRELFGNLFMLQAEGGPGSNIRPFLDNYPLWSLSYEFWFYIIYGALMWLGGSFERKRILACVVPFLATLLDLWHPNQASRFISYFPLWWVGVELVQLYRQDNKIELKKLGPAAIFLALPMLARALDLFLHSETGQLTLYGYREIALRRFVTVGILIAIGLLWQALKFRGFWRIFGIFRWVAPISYALYVTHAPVLRIASTLSPIHSGLLNFIWICPLVLSVAWVIEVPIQRAVNRLFPLTRTPTPEPQAGAT